MSRIAVLTGDIVKSTKLAPQALSALREVILTAASDAGRFGAVDAPATTAEFFRGDEWQAAVVDWSEALRAAVFVRATAIAAGGDTRVAIGIGEVERLDRQNVSLSSGEAFTLSGRALDGMKRSQALALAGTPFAPSARPWVDAALRLCDETLSRWTRRQAEFALRYLREPPAGSLAEVAETFGTRPQTISASLTAAGWRAVEHLLQVFAARAGEVDDTTD